MPEGVYRVRFSDGAGEHVGFDGQENASGLEGFDHAFEGFLDGREVVEQCAGDDQVIGFRFDCIVEDVNAADL